MEQLRTSPCEKEPLSLFPVPYPDESYYSILCRYMVQSGLPSTRRALYSLFGFKIVPAGLVLGFMSVVIIFGKAWCAMRVSQIDELISHLV